MRNIRKTDESNISDDILATSLEIKASANHGVSGETLPLIKELTNESKEELLRKAYLKNKTMARSRPELNVRKSHFTIHRRSDLAYIFEQKAMNVQGLKKSNNIAQHEKESTLTAAQIHALADFVATSKDSS